MTKIRKIRIKSDNIKSLFTGSKRRQTPYRRVDDGFSHQFCSDARFQSETGIRLRKTDTRHRFQQICSNQFRIRIEYDSHNKNKHKSCIYQYIYRSYNHHMIIRLTWISYIQNIYIHIYKHLVSTSKHRILHTCLYIIKRVNT